VRDAAELIDDQVGVPLEGSPGSRVTDGQGSVMMPSTVS
jgi:hypothetical protein